MNYERYFSFHHLPTIFFDFHYCKALFFSYKSNSFIQQHPCFTHWDLLFYLSLFVKDSQLVVKEREIHFTHRVRKKWKAFFYWKKIKFNGFTQLKSSVHCRHEGDPPNFATWLKGFVCYVDKITETFPLFGFDCINVQIVQDMGNNSYIISGKHASAAI